MRGDLNIAPTPNLPASWEGVPSLLTGLIRVQSLDTKSLGQARLFDPHPLAPLSRKRARGEARLPSPTQWERGWG